MSENQLKKEKKWLYFALGLVAGFVICGAYSLINQMVHNKSQSLTQTIKHIYHHEPSNDTLVKYVNYVKKSAPDKQALLKDSLRMAAEADEMDEAEFYMDEDEFADDNVVLVDKIIGKKTVKVQFKDDDFNDIPASDNDIIHFEVQQWNTPIKNRISYHRDNSVVQIKGLSIDKIAIVCYDRHYYLHYADQYYLLENNEGFQKIGPAVSFK
ncbi:MAG: hypothetical protein MJZ52_01155 [Bacteroidales bacterium]|nr:hypothetical protein [Bacteroidales bacterium]